MVELAELRLNRTQFWFLNRKRYGARADAMDGRTAIAVVATLQAVSESEDSEWKRMRICLVSSMQEASVGVML